MANNDKDFAQTVADAIIKQLEQGTAPWQKPWDGGSKFLPHNPVSGTNYKGINALYLMAVQDQKGFDDPRWMTYNQADSLGGQVRKGEKATTVQYWQWTKQQDKKDEQGRPIVGVDGKPEKETVRLQRPWVKNFSVFNAEQIDGLPPPTQRPQLPQWERDERADAIMQNSGAKIEHKTGDRAFYQPATDRIVLPNREQFGSQGAYYGTALHELGHWTGSSERLDRDVAHPFGSEGYAREELRAEIASMMLADEIGVEHDPEQHAAYVGSWIKALKEDPTEILRAASDAQKINRFVMQFDPQTQKLEQERGGAKPGGPLMTARETEVEAIGAAIRDSHAAKPGFGPAFDEAAFALTDAVLAKDAGWTADATGADRAGLPAVWLGNGLGRADATAIVGAAWSAADYVEGVSVALGADDGAKDAARSYQASRDDADGAAIDNAELASVVWQELHRNDAERPEAPSWYVAPEDRQHPLTAAMTDEASASDALVAKMAAELVAQKQTRSDAKIIAEADTPLTAGFRERQAVKELGAKWNKEEKHWFVPKGEDLAPFAGWLPKQGEAVAAEASIASTKAAPQSAKVATEKTYLNVPYDERSAAKVAGAKWDKAAKSWYAPAGTDLGPLVSFTAPAPAGLVATGGQDIHQQFGEAIKQAGLRLEGAPLMDGKMHRVPVDGDTGKERSGAYKGFTDGRPAGYIENFKTGEKQTWKADATMTLTPAERHALAVEAQQRREDREKQQAVSFEKAAGIAVTIVATTQAAGAEHPYLARKGVAPNGIRMATEQTVAQADAALGKGHHSIAAGDLILPMQRADGETRSLQVIKGDGWKGFMPGGQVSGLHAMLGDPKATPDRPQWVAEGFATAASIHEARKGDPVAIAFNAGNLTAVAKEMREQGPDRDLFIAGDDDRHLPFKNPPRPNVGRQKAEEAAIEAGGIALLPTFGSELDGMDWNDVAEKEGLSGLARELQESVEQAQLRDYREKLEQHQKPDSLAVRTEDRLEAMQEAIAAFRHIGGSDGLATERAAALSSVQPGLANSADLELTHASPERSTSLSTGRGLNRGGRAR